MVARWHANPRMQARQDFTGQHSARMAALAMVMFPAYCKGDLILAIMQHDMGEIGPGDLSRPFKQANPDVRLIAKEAEQVAIDDMGMPKPDLSDLDERILSFVDSLDAYLWAAYVNPRILAEQGWPELRAYLMREAGFLGVTLDTVHAMEQVNYGTN